MGKVEYFPSRGLYVKFEVDGKEYQVLPSKILLKKGMDYYDICKYCSSGFGGECPQFVCRDEVMACSGDDRRDGENVYFESDKTQFIEK